MHGDSGGNQNTSKNDKQVKLHEYMPLGLSFSHTVLQGLDRKAFIRTYLEIPATYKLNNAA